MGLKEMFQSMDSDGNGTITLEELRQGLAKQGTKLSEYEVKQLMEAVSSQNQHIIRALQKIQTYIFLLIITILTPFMKIRLMLMEMAL